MKKVFVFLYLIFILCCITSCFENSNEFKTDKYECYIHDTDKKEISIGNILERSEEGVIFVPYTINDYKVTKLGFHCYITEEMKNYWINRIYFPSSILEIRSPIYLSSENKYTIFFSSKPFKLLKLSNNPTQEKLEIYVPYEYYEDYIAINDPIRNCIRPANVNYYYNLNLENDIYYVDCYENNSLIEYMPPNPEKEGYTFDGWYKEAECINQWDFDSDFIYNTEEYHVTNLYAKWSTL